MKNSFVMYYEWFDTIEMLTKEQRGELLYGIYKYQVGEEEPVFEDKTLDIMFTFMRQQFSRDSKKYDELSKTRSKAAQKRWDKDKITNE